MKEDRGGVQPVGPGAVLKLQRGLHCSGSGSKPHMSVFELAGVHMQGVRAECSRLRLQGRR